MIRIQLNERQVEIEDGTTLSGLRADVRPDADVAIVNGFPSPGDTRLADGDVVALFMKSAAPPEAEMEALLVARHTPGVHEKVKAARVGIAGLGGLGSQVALALARTGVGTLVLADHDVVEPSNLNRQQYWIDQLGMPKVEALTRVLARVNPYVEIVPHAETVTTESARRVFEGCKVVAECFDRPEAKAELVRGLLGRVPVVAASGLAGFGPANAIRTTKRSDGLYIVGDGESAAMPGRGLMAPRVGVAAHHQANAVLRLLLELDPCRD